MAERPPAPPITGPIITTDLVVNCEVNKVSSRLYWFPDESPSGVSDLTVIADKIKTEFTTAYCALLPSRHYFQKVVATWYGPGTESFFAESTSSPAAGAIDVTNLEDDGMGDADYEDIMPLDNALIVQVKTGNRGREFQGRRFFGGVAEKLFYRGQLVEAYWVKAKTLAAKVNTTIAVSGSGFTTTLNARHWNRKANTWHPITSVYVVLGAGSRKDRRPKNIMQRL